MKIINIDLIKNIETMLSKKMSSKSSGRSFEIHGCGHLAHIIRHASLLRAICDAILGIEVPEHLCIG
jgi:hypothetical protein